MFIALKPLKDRPGRVSADQVVNRLRRQTTSVPGATLFLQAQQDIQIGGRGGDSQYQYTLSDENLTELNSWAPQLLARMAKMPELRDVSTDQQNQGLATNLVIDRDTASRLGISAAAIDSVLYDAFGQREVSTMYTALNQYFVVMEVDPKYQLSPDSLNGIFIKASNVHGATTAMPATVSTAAPTAVSSAPAAATPPAAVAPASTAPSSSSGGAMVPLSAIAHYENRRTSLAVNHQGQYPAVTLTFNLAPNVALGDAVTALEKVQAEMGMPSGIHASFQGTAQAFQDSLKNEPYLILAAVVAVYIVLGILYESLIHPLTILSTLPPAGAGAILALLLTGTELSIIALIGIILLIGIVKKNAIMMIDFALQAERDQGLPPVEAIYQACLLRFRPIMMTTMAAMFGGMPLAIGMGVGSELRKPLGITIVGGLLVSQALTLFTTPVVYLFFDKLQWKVMKLHRVGSELEEATGD
jgi:multidrug efflux pump subunit AcrB